MKSAWMVRLAMLAGLAAATHGGAQSKQWDKRYGGTLADSGGWVWATSDGGFIVGGSSSSGVNGDKTQASQGGSDYWVVKADANGNKQWDKRFVGAGTEYLGSLRQTPDGGYILGGRSNSGASGDRTEDSRGNSDYWLVKLNAAGAKQWDRRFGGPGSDFGGYVGLAADGGYFLGGDSFSGIGGDKTQDTRGDYDYWVVKMDANGVKQWDRRFGGADREAFTDLQPTPDGGCILGGYSESDAGGDKTEATRGGDDYWVVKLAANGTKQWDKRFGGSGDDNLYSAHPTADGGYLLAGESASPTDGDKTALPKGGRDCWVVKLNAQGNKLWDRCLGGADNEYNGFAVPTADGGCLVACEGGSIPGGDVTEPSRGLLDFWVVKLDALGTRRWDKRFGGSGQDWPRSIAQMADGGYLVAGESDSPVSGDKTEASRGLNDYWVAKIGAWPADAYEPDDQPGAAKPIANGQTQNHSIHEPGDQDMVKITVTAPGAVNARIDTSGTVGDTILGVYNAIGGLVARNDDIGGANKFSRVTIPALPPGTYYIQAVAYGNNVALPAYTLTANWTQNYEPDRYESDNGRGTARRIRNGRIQNRSIHAAGNRDWAKFTIAAGGARDVRIETRGASGDTRIRLYNRRLRRLAQDDDSGPGLFSRIRRSSLPAGTYYVRIQEKGDDGTIGAYTLKVRWTQR